MNTRDILIKFRTDLLVNPGAPIPKNYNLSNMANLVIPDLFHTKFLSDKQNLVCRASIGKGRVAEIPWIAVVDKDITSTITRGFYVVILYDLEEIYIGLGLGTEKLLKQYKAKESRIIMNIMNSQIIEAARHRFPDAPFKIQSPQFRSNSKRAIDYKNACSYGLQYRLSELPDEETLNQYLSTLIEIYCYLSQLYKDGDILQDYEVDYAPEIGSNVEEIIIENAKYRQSKSYERNPETSKIVKKRHGYRCQVCDFDFEEIYGELGKEYIEAHHIIPFSNLVEGEHREANILTDFSVLCSNCHRMIHRKSPPLTIDQLKEIILKQKENI